MFAHIFGWTPGRHGMRSFSPEGGDYHSPGQRPGSCSSPHWGFQALQGRNKRHPAASGGRPRSSPPCCFALSGLPTTKKGASGPRPLAWAVVVRPFGACFGGSNAVHPVGVFKPCKGAIKATRQPQAAVRVRPHLAVSPFQGFPQQKVGFWTPAVGLGCGSPPLRGLFRRE